MSALGCGCCCCAGQCGEFSDDLWPETAGEVVAQAGVFEISGVWDGGGGGYATRGFGHDVGVAMDDQSTAGDVGEFVSPVAGGLERGGLALHTGLVVAALPAGGGVIRQLM